MFFIGIISEEKNEKYIKEMLKHNINNSNVIFINEKNIDNIKNVKFKIIVLYKELINKIKEISPESHINIMAIFHISSDAKVNNESENNERIDLFNNKIRNMCSETDTTYIDINSYYIDENGFLKSESTTDGIHFTSDYYKKYLYRLITQ